MTFIDELDKLRDDDDFWKAVRNQRDRFVVDVRAALAALDLEFERGDWNALEGVGEDIASAGGNLAELGNYLDNMDTDYEAEGEKA